MSEYTLRPGLLVSMNTSLRGNVHYQVQDLESGVVDDDGARRSRWETTKVISDPAEHEAAQKLRTKVRGLILSVCSSSAFGLLCPNQKQDELTAAITEARNLVEEYNAGAALTRVSFNVIYGRIAQDDVEAVKAITAEIRQLMDDMQEGIASMDVKIIREAANKAKAVGEMLSDDAQARLEVAITASRQSARQIAKMVKAGEAAAITIDKAAIAQIDMARTSFLDFDMSDFEVAAPAVTGRSIDLEV